MVHAHRLRWGLNPLHLSRLRCRFGMRRRRRIRDLDHRDTDNMCPRIRVRRRTWQRGVTGFIQTRYREVCSRGRGHGPYDDGGGGRGVCIIEFEIGEERSQRAIVVFASSSCSFALVLFFFLSFFLFSCFLSIAFFLAPCVVANCQTTSTPDPC